MKAELAAVPLLEMRMAALEAAHGGGGGGGGEAGGGEFGEVAVELRYAGPRDSARCSGAIHVHPSRP